MNFLLYYLPQKVCWMSFIFLPDIWWVWLFFQYGSTQDWILSNGWVFHIHLLYNHICRDELQRSFCAIGSSNFAIKVQKRVNLHWESERENEVSVNSKVDLLRSYRFKLCDVMLWSLPAKMRQSRLSLLISHWDREKILILTVHWLAQKKWLDNFFVKAISFSCLPLFSVNVSSSGLSFRWVQRKWRCS